MDEILTKHASALAEHFDTVRIFVTKHDGNTESTLELTTGVGNIYAQRGQVGD